VTIRVGKFDSYYKVIEVPLPARYSEVKEKLNMANRTKTERNKMILELVNKGWRYISIANMMKMKVSAVSMVIWRARRGNGNENK